MGLDDRDRHWKRRAARARADDDHLFPGRRWPHKSSVFVVALLILTVLALLVLGLGQGWFDRGGRSHAEKVRAEIAAVRAGEQKAQPNGRPGAVPMLPPADVSTSVDLLRPKFGSEYRESIQFAMVGVLMLSPFVLIGLLISLFIRRLRLPALVGLVSGIAGGYIAAQAQLSWGLLYWADSMGAAFEFFAMVIDGFALTAAVAAIATFVLGKRGAAPSPPGSAPGEADGR